MTHCPRCGKTALQPDAIHTCSPKALVLADLMDKMHPAVVPHADAVAAELRRLHQSEREGWRYADEVEHERKQLQAMLNQERTESEALLRQALEALDRADKISRFANHKVLRTTIRTRLEGKA